MNSHVVDGLKVWLHRDCGVSESALPTLLDTPDKWNNPLDFIYDRRAAIDQCLGKKVKKYGVLYLWGKVEKTSPLIFLLIGWKFGLRESIRAIKTFEVDKIELEQLLENPYLLVGSRIPFSKIDKIALEHLKIPAASPQRICGYAVSLLNNATNNGHLCLGFVTVYGSVCRDLDVSISEDDFKTLLLSGQYRMMLDHNYVYTEWAYNTESFSAMALSEFIYERNDIGDVTELVDRFQTAYGITLSKLQTEAIHLAVKHNVFVLTGLPGTGKTTLLKCFCFIFNRLLGKTPLLLTPTGISARNLAEVTTLPAYTIHKALGFNGSEWQYGEHRRYDADIVIIDEFSMVDQVVFYHLVSAMLAGRTRLIFVGDAAQLPSVGAGNVLHELIACKKIPTVALTEIFRQNEASDIVLNAHNINSGKPLVSRHTPPDFLYLKNQDHAAIKNFIVMTAQKLYNDNKTFQVISPMYDGPVGVDALNEALRETLNPAAPEKAEGWISNILFREGDRVIITKNSYKLDVYNGDMGKIKKISVGGNAVQIKLFKPLRYVDLQLNDDALTDLDLKMAYCITVHKTQGLEFDYVVLPLVSYFRPLLQRNLFYTAVTRAKKKMVLIGDPQAITTAIRNNQITRRNTFFGQRIIDCLAKTNMLIVPSMVPLAKELSAT